MPPTRMTSLLVNSIVVLAITLPACSSISKSDASGADSDVIRDFLPATPEDRLTVVVSNLDGSVTALNGRTGDVQWTFLTGTKALLSSSISDLQMIRNGVPTRLVPSLDGSLYQMDGEGVESIPLAADVLLTSTHKLTDESSIVGGKEIETYGVDVDTGKLRYICSSEKCRRTSSLDGEPGGADDEVLVVRRTDRTVRMVDIIDGNEKWNFSVGKVEVSYHSRSDTNSFHTIGGDFADDGGQAEGEYRHSSLHPRFLANDFDPNIKVKMPSKVVFAVNRADPGQVYWEHEFSTPIAGVWTMKGRDLCSVSLFSDQSILKTPGGTLEDWSELGSGQMYIGIYNSMLYAQPSDLMRDHTLTFDIDGVDVEEVEGSSNEVQVYMPRVKWKPYLATAFSRTPIIANEKTISPNAADSTPGQTGKSLSLSFKNQYPFDGGYYLYLGHEHIGHFGVCNNATLIVRSKRMAFFSALCKRWRELGLCLCLFAAYAMSYLKRLTSNKKPKARNPPPVLVSQSCSAQHDLAETLQIREVGRDIGQERASPLQRQQQQFDSRYLTDFQQQDCLGKGGFGVVFKAHNRIDECSYAIKRIALKDSKVARDKVMREVKALAKLDHPGIVRYYQSWFECPPPGWQEERDRLIISGQSGSYDTDTSATSAPNLTSQAHNPNTTTSHSKAIRMEDTESSGGIVFDESVKVDLPTSDDDDDDDDVEEEEEEEGNDWSGDSVDPKNGGDKSHISTDSGSASIVFRDSHDLGGQGDLGTLRRRNVASRSDSSVVFMNDSGSAGHDIRPRCHGECTSSKVIPNKSKQTGKRPGKHLKAKEGIRASREEPRKLYLYIQMQLCRPESLKEWLSDPTLDPEANYDVFYQIVSAIAYVHSQNVMHRDLKPSNIFFAMDGTIKIGDFGLATGVEKISNNNHHVCLGEGGTDRERQEKHTNQVGTQLYMSPELSSGQNYTHKVDMYALGVIFFEMFQRFSTHMERATMLQQLRRLQFPRSFITKFKDEHEFIVPLLSHDPSLRPEASDLLRHRLLAGHEESSNLIRRLHRVRTSSMHSSSSST